MDESRIAVLEVQVKETARRQNEQDARLTRLETSDRTREIQVAVLKAQLAIWGFIGASVGGAVIHVVLDLLSRKV